MLSSQHLVPGATIFAHDGDKDDFIITDDTPVMWQYMPYITTDAALEDLIVGATNRQAASVILDPPANAFSHNASTSGSQDHQNDARKPKSAPAAFEGKYEIGSLASVLKLCPTSPYWY